MCCPILLMVVIRAKHFSPQWAPDVQKTPVQSVVAWLMSNICPHPCKCEGMGVVYSVPTHYQLVSLWALLVTEAFSPFQSTLTSGPLQLSMHCQLWVDTGVTWDWVQPAVDNQPCTQCRWKATMSPVSFWLLHVLQCPQTLFLCCSLASQ